ncbi:TetR family transcriptional regulator [Secundilactobacillus paracollinoides]|uniref:TetR/AcrR family transcriptional regulator n=1 Tax=Secundilactobacillus paracollinoides TaxID=240427 RepID=UPI0006D1EADD|nr:TetR/AcrR family transcriptional regulator [Secundilactobacillus paracollinoides]ANZ64900.1 TetR family transcriptional regulator [Secundilactobacillus paracollinoides]KRL80975.1 hypothetical protein FC17_GL002789 [Secundilactobacillus paracollinoides DSM 15502 = JCM 11969]
MREKDTAKAKTIIDQVGHIILEEGISNVSMSRIAKASGISSSTIYVYFADKEDVLKQVYLANKQGLADYLAEHVDQNISDAVAYVRAFMTAVYDFGQTHYDALMIIDQFNHSPLLAHLAVSEAESFAGFEPLFARVKQAPSGTFQAVDPLVLLSFGYAPVVMYLQAIKRRQLDADATTIDQVVTMCLNAMQQH